MPGLQHKITKRSEIQSKNSPAIKRGCGPQEGYCEKRCEIQGGSQEMAVMENFYDSSGEFGAKLQ